MAVSYRGGGTELQVPQEWKGRETSPERNRIWAEPQKNKEGQRAVPVVYYLCRNGRLEHPHFMEVPLSSPEGLHLRDVIDRLNFLRGKGVASMYSWSCKRSYKNGFVWHDLAENDLISPAHGHDHILKGSELLPSPSNPDKPLETASSASTPETHGSGECSSLPAAARRRNQSWSSSDFNEYKVYYKITHPSGGDFAGKAADASTQTDDKRRRRGSSAIRGKKSGGGREEEEIKEEEPESAHRYPNQRTELSKEEVSPPPSDWSPEALELLTSADGKMVRGSADNHNRTARSFPSGRTRSSTVLMQLISCGSIAFKNWGVAALKDPPPSTSEDGSRGGGGRKVGWPPRGENRAVKGETRGSELEEKEYFSGSLIETRKKDETFSALKRSSSYNADRVSRLGIEEGVRAKCIPRKLKAPLVVPKKEGNGDVSCSR